MILILLILLRFVLWPRTWYILGMVQQVYREKVSSAVVGRGPLHVSVRFCQFTVLLRSSASWWGFHLAVLSVCKCAVLKSQPELSVFLFRLASVSFHLCILRLYLSIHIYDLNCSAFLADWSLYHYVVPQFFSSNLFCSEDYFIWNHIAMPISLNNIWMWFFGFIWSEFFVNNI